MLLGGGGDAGLKIFIESEKVSELSEARTKILRTRDLKINILTHFQVPKPWMVQAVSHWLKILKNILNKSLAIEHFSLKD